MKSQLMDARSMDNSDKSEEIRFFRNDYKKLTY